MEDPVVLPERNLYGHLLAGCYELVGVMDTFQCAISNVEKKRCTRNTNNATVALVNGFQRTVLQRTTEQITDVSRGNTAALVGIEQFLLKLGTLTTVENAHNTADTKYSVFPVAKIISIYKNKTDCDTAYNK